MIRKLEPPFMCALQGLIRGVLLPSFGRVGQELIHQLPTSLTARMVHPYCALELPKINP